MTEFSFEPSSSSPSEIEVLYNMWDWKSSSATQIIQKSVVQIIEHPQYNTATVSHLL